ncbi:unnamed protein product [Fraxinus pennsylvanica]|uniref:dihydrolipoyllysine-residue succinyltransferase n=1 Tax=Fraxinus pennsylvanica TaxID=56036 RepID=A0AAD2E7Z2_9LAMI|nr:unnamed protein product [Fraxinus pennsylvanica]
MRARLQVASCLRLWIFLVTSPLELELGIAVLEVGSLWSIGSDAANFCSDHRLAAVNFWRRQQQEWKLSISGVGIAGCDHSGGNLVIIWALYWRTNLMELRSDYKDAFVEKHGVKLGLASGFVKAAVSALQNQPIVNVVIDGDDIIYRDYVDISIAVGNPKARYILHFTFFTRNLYRGN